MPRGEIIYPTNANDMKTIIEIWSVSDIISDPNSSSSQLKRTNMHKIYHYQRRKKSDLVIAVGTAAYNDEESYNGSVVVGSKFFILNPYTDEDESNPESDWQHEIFDKLIDSTVPEKFYIGKKGGFDGMLNNDELPKQIEKRFIIPPLNPASKLKFHIY